MLVVGMCDHTASIVKYLGLLIVLGYVTGASLLRMQFEIHLKVTVTA